MRVAKLWENWARRSPTGTTLSVLTHSPRALIRAQLERGFIPGWGNLRIVCYIIYNMCCPRNVARPRFEVVPKRKQHFWRSFVRGPPKEDKPLFHGDPIASKWMADFSSASGCRAPHHQWHELCTLCAANVWVADGKNASNPSYTPSVSPWGHVPNFSFLLLIFEEWSVLPFRDLLRKPFLSAPLQVIEQHRPNSSSQPFGFFLDYSSEINRSSDSYVSFRGINPLARRSLGVVYESAFLLIMS